MLEQEQLDLSSRHAMHALIAYWNPPFQNSRFATGPPCLDYAHWLHSSYMYKCSPCMRTPHKAASISLRDSFKKSLLKISENRCMGIHHLYLHSNQNNSVCMCNRVFGSRCMTLCVIEENSCHSSNPCSSFRNF